MRAAAFCRVATEDQERLESQKEACLKRAHELDYEVPEEFIILETCSGSTPDRPKLHKLRQWVRDKEVDAVIAYTLDRLSRNLGHLIILLEEMEKAGVTLILVTEVTETVGRWDRQKVTNILARISQQTGYRGQHPTGVKLAAVITPELGELAQKRRHENPHQSK